MDFLDPPPPEVECPDWYVPRLAAAFPPPLAAVLTAYWTAGRRRWTGRRPVMAADVAPADAAVFLGFEPDGSAVAPSRVVELLFEARRLGAAVVMGRRGTRYHELRAPAAAPPAGFRPHPRLMQLVGSIRFSLRRGLRPSPSTAHAGGFHPRRVRVLPDAPPEAVSQAWFGRRAAWVFRGPALAVLMTLWAASTRVPWFGGHALRGRSYKPLAGEVGSCLGVTADAVRRRWRPLVESGVLALFRPFDRTWTYTVSVPALDIADRPRVPGSGGLRPELSETISRFRRVASRSSRPGEPMRA